MFGFNKKNYLKRTDFINSVDSNKIWSEKMTISEIRDLLDKLELELSKYDFNFDKNFIMNTRRKALKSMIEGRLRKDDNKIDKLAAESLFNFWEFVGDEYAGSVFSILPDLEKLGVSAQDFNNMDKAYRDKGIICLQEKNVILEIINEIKRYINK